MNIKLLFGQNVKKYRQLLLLSQEDLADKCGLHRTYISDIERCKRSISLDNIQKIADALNVRVFELFLESNNDEY